MKKSKIILLLSAILLITSLFAVGCGDGTFKVTFDGNGGNLISGRRVQQVKEASDIKIPVFEKPGYTLSWDKDISAITEETTVTAQWTVNNYTITFDLNAPNATMQGETTMEVTFDEPLSLPTPTRSGFTFVGWKKGSVNGEDVVNGANYSFPEDITAVAVWSAGDFTVDFVLEGIKSDGTLVLFTIDGKNDIDNVIVKYGETLGDKLPDKSKLSTKSTECSADGWTAADANGREITITSSTVFNVETFGEERLIKVIVKVNSDWSKPH